MTGNAGDSLPMSIVRGLYKRKTATDDLIESPPSRVRRIWRLVGPSSICCKGVGKQQSITRTTRIQSWGRRMAATGKTLEPV